jgi:CRISPR-associated protein Cas5d
MSMATVSVRVSGDLACFTRPEMKVERVSYEVPTPSAARGILDAICWRPQMRWVITRILVLRPVAFQAFRRNEVQDVVSTRRVAQWMNDPTTYSPQQAGGGAADATPRQTLALRNVVYVIEATPHVFAPTAEDTPAKYAAMLRRRVEKGQCFHRPYLGCREFACDFRPAHPEELPIAETRPLGPMLYDVVFAPDAGAHRPVFFDAALRGGILDTAPDRVLVNQIDRQEVLACSSVR